MEVVLGSASRRLGRYELVSYLGSGGMSDVYVALHTGLRKRFALKMLRPSMRGDPSAVERFLREGECAARVSHPNVVDVSDVGTDNGVPYLVMELIEGETLAEKLAREGPLSVERAVDILLPILDALATAHAASVLHRDVKPSNILLARTPDGSLKPKLLDFGIAELRDRGDLDGARQGPIGTPHYMSPEQARGEPLEESSDQYSLGSVLFEMLTGREPFGGGGVDEVIAKVAQGKFPYLENFCRTAPRSLSLVLARMAARDPKRRYPSLSDVSRALVPFASARTQRLWISRDQRVGLSSAQLLSGAYRAERVDPPAVLPSVGPRASALRRRPPATSLRAFIGGVGLALGIFAGLWVTEGEAAANKLDPAIGAESPHPAHETVRVRAVPRDALIRFDGDALGVGTASLPPFGDRLHELRVSAPGYIDRVILFHGRLEETTITLNLQ